MTGRVLASGCLLALVAILMSCPVPAQARDTVQVGRRVVIRFQAAKGVNPDARATAVQKKVDALLRKRLPASKITVLSHKGVMALAWAGQIFCTVDPSQASLNHCSVRDLAERWAHNLREAVEEGVLAVSPGRMAVPVGETRKAVVQGLASGPVRLEFDSHGIEVVASSDGATLSVKGLSPGRWALVLHREDAHVTVPVVVKEYAGVVPERTTFSVSGNPADRLLLQEAAVQAARSAVQARPGASVTLRGTVGVPATLDAGREVTVRLAIEVEGEAYFPVSRTLEVALRNENVALATPSLLMVSNRPEKIGDEGILFRGTFRRDQATRLLYSHVNGARGPQYMWVAVVNRSDRPVRMLAIQADGGPAREELFVGHRCNTRFLEDLHRRQGLIVTVPAGKAWELGRYRLDTRELVSGLCHLQILDGNELEVTVETSPQGVRIGQLNHVFEAPFNPFMIHPKGIFAEPNIVLDQKFVVGDQESIEIPFGRAPWLIDPQSGEPNTGNYGVLYEMRVELSNPTSQACRVALFFEPINGVALGSFLVEGKLMETQCVKPPARGLIGTIELAPRQTRSLRILTLPQAGSHYPARIVIRPTIQETRRGTGGS